MLLQLEVNNSCPFCTGVGYELELCLQTAECISIVYSIFVKLILLLGMFPW